MNAAGGTACVTRQMNSWMRIKYYHMILRQTRILLTTKVIKYRVPLITKIGWTHISVILEVASVTLSCHRGYDFRINHTIRNSREAERR